MFTGESGSVTYLFVLLLLSLSCICRAVAARREGGRKELGALSSGLALFVAARVFGLYSMRAGSEALSLFAAVSGLFGLYLMMTSIVCWTTHRTARLSRRRGPAQAKASAWKKIPGRS